MTDIKRVLADNIKAFRSKKGLSQEKLAEKIGIAPHYLAMIETCKNFPSADMIERIAKGLDQDSIDLFGSFSQKQNWKDALVSDIGIYIDEKLTEIGLYVDKKLNE